MAIVKFTNTDWNTVYSKQFDDNPLNAQVVGGIRGLFGFLNGLTVKNSDTHVEIQNVTNYNIFNLSAALLAVSFNGLIEELPIYVSMTASQLSDTVPEGIEGRDLYDEDGNVSGQKDWTQWAGDYGREIKDLTDGTKGFELSNGSTYLPSSQWILLNNDYTLLDQPSCKVLMPQDPLQ